MRISDWSSDVCSSDLGDALVARNVRLQLRDFHLDHVGHGVRWRRQPVRPADLGDGGGHHERGPAVGPAPGARGGADGGLGGRVRPQRGGGGGRSEEHTSELQSLMRISYAVFCLKKKKNHNEQLLYTPATNTPT